MKFFCGFAVLWVLSLICTSSHATGPKHDRRVVCYMASWGLYLAGNGKFDVPDAAPALPMCTHLVYVFLGLDKSDFTLKPADAHRDLLQNGGQGGIAKSVAFREKFPHLKVMVGIGGWNDGSISYSKMVGTRNSRTNFIKSVVTFLQTNKLDGLEINWQFPGDRGGSPADRGNLVELIKEMRDEFDKHGLIVSVAVSCFPYRISLGIDALRLSKYAHFLNIMTYEYHGFWEQKVGIGTPLHADDELNIEFTLNMYKRLGVPADKINLGISNYGMTFYLNEPANSTKNVIGAPAKNFGFKGTYHAADGFMGYNEICLELKDPQWLKGWHEESLTPYAVRGDRVISYDNVQSIREKVNFAMEKKLGGILYYGLEKDDFRNDCGDSKYPLLTAIDESLLEFSELIFADLLPLFQKHGATFFWNGMKN